MTAFRLLAVVGLVFSALALSACGSDEKDKIRFESGNPGVNGYLWRASLDTLSFMPMVDVDPRAGALISDWYIDPDAPSERMKVSVFILGGELRADTLKVTVIRQVRSASGIWLNEDVQAGTELKIEDAILARARQLRIDTLEN